VPFSVFALLTAVAYRIAPLYTNPIRRIQVAPMSGGGGCRTHVRTAFQHGQYTIILLCIYPSAAVDIRFNLTGFNIGPAT